MDQFTRYMESVNTYIESPFGMVTVCTAPIVVYFVFKLYIKPLFQKKEQSPETRGE